MGSRSTKLVQPLHVEATASQDVLARKLHQKGDKTNETGPRQDLVYLAARRKSTSRQPCDDIDLATGTHTYSTKRRRYSEPAHAVTMDRFSSTDRIAHLAAFESFLAERELMQIDIDYAEQVNPVPIEQRSNPITSVPVEKKAKVREDPEVQCVACCTQLPKRRDPRHALEVIKPCRSCNSAYCIACVRDMFLSACKDSARMPPRCCMPIHLHHIKTHLTSGEISEYRSKYEEWSTEKPFYCPKPVCSAFISQRLLPERTEGKRRRKVDSGIGTPEASHFQCPKCDVEICVDCRQLVHPDSLCTNLDFGIDPDTAALLKSWGYKRCPKCGQGLKRMYGCNHMECRCGAHFCWGCMKGRDDCEGGCSDQEEDYDGYESDANDSDSDHSEASPEPGHEMNEGQATASTAVEATVSEPTVPERTESASEPTTAPRPAPRPRNLDGGTSRYWEQQDLDFGEEPTDDVQDRSWECQHRFFTHKISLTEAMVKAPEMYGMECVKCWCAIKPDIETPPEPIPASESPRTRRAPSGRGRGGRRGRGRGIVGGFRPATYTPPRGLTRLDATVGTASHLTVEVPTGRPLPGNRKIDPMEDIQIDLPTNSRRLVSDGRPKDGAAASNIFGGTPSNVSLAQECDYCNLLVCKECADSLLGKEAERDARAEEEDAAETAEVTGVTGAVATGVAAVATQGEV